MKGSITINQELCKGCLLCASFCPRKSLSQSGKLNRKGYLVAEFDAAERVHGLRDLCPGLPGDCHRGLP